ncbi:S-adenosyl-L-methionine-dependent methyltransferase [Baffinella frigidus]|nr:S-adenosyl-L-methionine-dependent methyltransferase [Cryptophyta sp. CCMP2293]
MAWLKAERVSYFTIPLLATADVAFLHACELNPNSVEALRRNLDLNKVADRCKIHHGDNRVTSAALHGIADRVLLGLLPSSEYAWPIAVACLKEGGGVLHVHENVSEADQQAWVMRLEAEIRAAGARLGRRWTVSCGHVERVKTFAPRVWHLVADVSCSPA